MMNHLPVMMHTIEGPPEERTLFLGDLSVYCTEEDIFQFFGQFGVVEKIRLKHATNNKNLSYGFVTYASRDVAVHVLQTMNGQLFLGRSLRLGWAAHKNQLTPAQIARMDNSPPSAQIHVSFLSKQTDILITETTLRSLFGRFGEVSDVAIKKIQFNPKMKIQHGYGFVHFPLTKEGITAAINATNMVRQYTIDRVTYDSCLTRSLEIVIESDFYKGQLPVVIPYPEHANVVNKDYNNLQTYGMSKPMVQPQSVFRPPPAYHRSVPGGDFYGNAPNNNYNNTYNHGGHGVPGNNAPWMPPQKQLQQRSNYNQAPPSYQSSYNSYNDYAASGPAYGSASYGGHGAAPPRTMVINSTESSDSSSPRLSHEMFDDSFNSFNSGDLQAASRAGDPLMSYNSQASSRGSPRPVNDDLYFGSFNGVAARPLMMENKVSTYPSYSSGLGASNNPFQLIEE